jgi:hypothetical protein
LYESGWNERFDNEDNLKELKDKNRNLMGDLIRAKNLSDFINFFLVNIRDDYVISL